MYLPTQDTLRKVLYKLTIRILIIFISLLISMLAAELFFWRINIASSSEQALLNNSVSKKLSNGSIPEQDINFFEYHPIFGHIGIPFKHGYLDDYETTINSKGYRDQEHAYEKPPGIKRILLLGDSQAWGIGVHDNETMARVLEKLLLDSGIKQKFEVINLGISGYGIDQSYLQLVIEGQYYSPDYVIFVFFPENDIIETNSHHEWGIEKPIFFTRNNDLCLANIPPSRSPGWTNNKIGSLFSAVPLRFNLLGISADISKSQVALFFSNRELESSLLSLIDKSYSPGSVISRLKCFLFKSPFCRLTEEFPCLQQPLPPVVRKDENDLKISELIIKNMVNKTNTIGAQFLTVNTPEESSYSSNEQDPIATWMADMMKTYGASFIDPSLLGHKEGMSPETFYSISGHLSARGNQLSGKLIRDWILEREN